MKEMLLLSYPIYRIETRGVRIANDTIIPVDEAIHFMIKFQGYVFEIIAYLANMTADYDFLIGQKSMYELEAGANFRNLSFQFIMRSLNLYSSENVNIKPGQTKTYSLELNELPPGMPDPKEEHDVIVKLKTFRSDQLVQTLLAKWHNNRVLLHATNKTDKIWKIKKGEMMGSMDMRSLGYFTVTRDNLNRIMKDHCNFLTEEETYEYFGLLNKDHEDIINYAQDQVRKLQNLQDNTKLVDRIKTSEKDTNIVPDKDEDPYPWLVPEDPRRNMTDKEILEKFVDLSDSDLTKKKKEQLYKVLLKYKAAFSLRDEIGLCPNMEVELELTDTSPFFIRPFPIKESEKEVVDKEMRKGCLLGILKKGMSSYSSPIILIPRKLTGIPRIVTDFRHLNSRLVTLQPSIPLVRDAIQILGASGCEVLSLADLRDAHHTLRLSNKSQKYCGITPYYGSDSYLYQRLGMGLSVSPAIWQNFI